MSKKNIAVIASFEKGRGGGHLVRSARMVYELNKAGDKACMYLPKTPQERGLDEARLTIQNTGLNLDAVPFLQDKSGLTEHTWDFLVIDRFITPDDEFNFYKTISPLIGIDEGGPRRAEFDFLLDLLPESADHCPPNLLRPCLLDLPKHRGTNADGTPPKEHDKLEILVCFGTEDSAGLGPVAAQSCYLPFVTRVTLVRPARNEHDASYKDAAEVGIKVVPPMPDLRDKLCNYDIVITHFGLTAFETLAAGVSVMIVSPTEYHEKLAQQAYFYSQGIGKKAAAQLGDMLFTSKNQGQGLFSIGQMVFPEKKKECINQGVIDALTERCNNLAKKFGIDAIGIDTEKKETLAEFVHALQPEKQKHCPVCGFDDYTQMKTAGRFEDRTYLQCPHCKIIFMNRFKPTNIAYTEKYFFENYKKQYGKTYLEDFQNLVSLAKRRLRIIKKLICAPSGSGQPEILDIGCAYGAFLDAARSEGFASFGIDISEDAVRYVKETLEIDAAVSDFEKDNAAVSERSFNIITLWYVIEHFADVQSVLQKCRKRLPTGGILAFATPNGAGISAQKSKTSFLKNSPADHITVWNSRDVKAQLQSFGFDVKKIVITGHHPERFPVVGQYISKKHFASEVIYYLFLLISKLFKLGDTFEIYAKVC